MKIKAFWLLLLLLVGLLFPRSLYSQSASTLSFSRHDLSLGGNPLGVVSADFNGDGKQDLAVLYAPSGATRTFVAMFIGNGDGTFTLLNTFDTGFAGPWMITADLNHDNKPDLVIANGFGRSISVFLGNGDGTFGTSTVIPLPGRIESVIAADFNGDGKLDLAAPDFEPQPYAVSILLGNGDGTFGPNTEFPTVDVPFVAIADDFNHDGKLDLALNTDLGTVSVIGSVLLGNGDGTFQPKKDFATGFTQSADLASGDFNNDGKTDLVVANNADDSISILLGNGDGTFTLQSSIALPVTPFRVLARDIDADGKMDLVVARRNSATVSILIGKGDGTFGAPLDFGVGAGPQFLVVKDLNGDGLLDIVTPNEDDGTVSILLNTTTHALTAACTVNGSTAPVTVLVTSLVAYNANPNPSSASTCDWNPGTPLPGAFDTAAGSSCSPSSPIYTAIAGGNFSESVTVTNGSNSVTSSCPALTVQDFSLSVTPPSATALPGGVAIYTVTASSISGFTGQINFVQSTTLPTGMSAVWNPASQSCTVPAGGSCSATYTVTVGAGASAGDTGLVFHGTYAPVLITRSANATLHVTPPAPTPTITSISPLSGNRGQTVKNFTVTGTNFDVNNATLSFIPPTGITAINYKSRTSTQISADVTIDRTAPIESKDVIVTNPGQASKPLTAGFRVDFEFRIFSRFSARLNELADEPSLAVDPKHPMHAVVGFNVLRDLRTGPVVEACGWAESNDGGESWKNKGVIVFPRDANGELFQANGDPWVRYGSDGALYYSCMGSTSSYFGVFMAVSTTGLAVDLSKPASPITIVKQNCVLNVKGKFSCTSTDAPSFAIVTGSTVSRLIACWVEARPKRLTPSELQFSIVKEAFSNGGRIWSSPPQTLTDKDEKGFACKVGAMGTLGNDSTLAITWLNSADDTLYFRTSRNGVTFDPKMTLAPPLDPLLKFGSTTEKVLSSSDALLIPGQNGLRAIWQSRQAGISKVFTKDLLSGSKGAPFGNEDVEKFLPGTGSCGAIAGVYQVTDATKGLFRYSVWSLVSLIPIGPIFASGEDLDPSKGIPDKNFPSFPRIGEYMGADCSADMGWAAWTDLRTGRAEIWGARIPLR